MRIRKFLLFTLLIVICCVLLAGCKKKTYEDTGMQITSENAGSAVSQEENESDVQPVEKNSMKVEELSESEKEMLEEMDIEEGIGIVEVVDPDTQEEKTPDENTTLEIEEGEAGSF